MKNQIIDFFIDDNAIEITYTVGGGIWAKFAKIDAFHFCDLWSRAGNEILPIDEIEESFFLPDIGKMIFATLAEYSREVFLDFHEPEIQTMPAFSLN